MCIRFPLALVLSVGRSISRAQGGHVATGRITRPSASRRPSSKSRARLGGRRTIGRTGGRSRRRASGRSRGWAVGRLGGQAARRPDGRAVRWSVGLLVDIALPRTPRSCASALVQESAVAPLPTVWRITSCSRHPHHARDTGPSCHVVDQASSATVRIRLFALTLPRCVYMCACLRVCVRACLHASVHEGMHLCVKGCRQRGRQASRHVCLHGCRQAC